MARISISAAPPDDRPRTVADIRPLTDGIRPGDGIISLGSCFSTEIGTRLAADGYEICNNPFGVLYNPVSIARAVDFLSGRRSLSADDVILRDTNPAPANAPARPAPHHRPIAPDGGGYVSFFHHGSFARKTPEEFLDNAQTALAEASGRFAEARWILVTFGTAWVYRHLEKDIIVSNCHKIPAREFERYRLSVEDIVTDYTHLLHELLQANPTLQVLFTVSPIRHWKDGAHGNQLSKATLLLAIDALRQRFPNVHYFPSYEIVLDELRNYRYYADDMLHLTPLAVNYIWERFSTTYFTPSTIALTQQVERLNRGMEHRPFNPRSGEYSAFLRGLLSTIEQLVTTEPALRLEKEKTILLERLEEAR